MSSHQTIAIFSSTWWMSIILTSMIIYFLLKWSSQATISQQKKTANAVGGFFLFIAFFIHIYQMIRGDWNLQTSLPLNLCSLSGILSGIVLLFPNQDLYEFLLFWGIPGAFHSFITPELTLGNQGWYFYDYYLAHAGIIFSVLYLSFIFKFKPRPYSWLKVFCWTQVLILIVFLIDKAIGANYMYLVQKPLAHNLFVFGVWPWYIVGFELAGLIHFYFVYLIFKRRNQVSNPVHFHKYGMKIALVFLSICILQPLASAQTGFQNIRGEIRDKDSEQALSYVSIALFRDTAMVQSVQSNEQGKFEFKAVMPGRYFLKTYLVGYKSSEIKDVILNSGKEAIVDILLDEEPQQLSEVTIHSTVGNEAVNEMILAGGKVFSVDETNRYAGSRGDPARMAASFAGTQSTDDSRNDIVIRGNSPLGILWRIQDVDIPNPNHFAIPGTTGGAISILNNKMFRNSDFLIGAFPAEYGNCNAGVFDIKLRNGNNEHHEGTAQFGFLGTELALEGPLSKKQNSTYLITYRYSTLKLFESFNVRIGTDAVPNYQDVSFKINIPLKQGDNLSFFGIGGTSKIDIILSKFDEPSEEIYGENNKDQYFKSSMGLVGATYSKAIKPSMLLKATISHNINFAGENDFTIYRNQDYKVDSLARSLGYRFNNNKSSLALTLQNKINSRNTIKAGMHLDLLYHDLLDSTYLPNKYSFLNRMDDAGYTTLWQAYVQWKFKWNQRVEMNSGIHMQYSAFNKQIVIEPRFSIQYRMNTQQTLSFGTGLHSQLQPYYIYFYKTVNQQGLPTVQNRNLGFSKSFHSTLGYDLALTDHLKLKLEAYYIRLFDIPVNAIVKSSYSVVNEGGEFGRFFPGKLENSGTGYNDGLEATLEKTFSSGYYFLFNTSLFESKYKGSDGVLRNTAYNANFTMNALMGKEIPFGRNHNKVLSLGSKISFAGGRRYSPADIPSSKLNGELIIQDAYRNDLQFKNYFRLDMKLGYKINTNKFTHEFGIDLVNVLNTKNILSLVYAPDPRNLNDNPIKQENQLGFLPLFYYKLDFTVKRH